MTKPNRTEPPDLHQFYIRGHDGSSVLIEGNRCNGRIQLWFTAESGREDPPARFRCALDLQELMMGLGLQGMELWQVVSGPVRPELQEEYDLEGWIRVLMGDVIEGCVDEGLEENRRREMARRRLADAQATLDLTAGPEAR